MCARLSPAEVEGRIRRMRDLYDGAFLGFASSSEESGTGCVFKDFPYSIVHLGGTFEILCCANLASDCLSLKESELEKREYIPLRD